MMEMDYQAYFEGALRDLKDEGNYRVFADLERHRGNFPNATRRNGTLVKASKCRFKVARLVFLTSSSVLSEQVKSESFSGYCKLVGAGFLSVLP